jgi:glucosyl-3-phosphoglycerate synthase
MFAETPIYDGRAVDRMDLVGRKAGQTVAVCLPARDEESTIGGIVEAIRTDLVDGRGRHGGLVDELVVMNDRSSDGTAARAEAAGAVVVDVAGVLPEAGRGSGKGNALWKSVAATTADIVVWCDADLRDFDTVFVTGLVAPLLLDTDVVFVKGYYERILGGEPGAGGRTTELMARPLLSLLFPELTVIRQPLGGEYAGRRSVLEQVPFVQGYGVEIGLLIDITRLVGIERVAQVDLGVRKHRNRTLGELSAQAMEILQTGLDRAGMVTERDWSHVLLRPEAEPLEVELRERPPLVSVNGYRQQAEANAALRAR